MNDDDRFEAVDQVSELVYDALKAAIAGDLETADTLADTLIRFVENTLNDRAGV